MKLRKDERIVAVVPESFAGPGWANRCVLVHIVDQQGKYRCVWLQRNQQSALMMDVFAVADHMHRLLLDEARKLCK